MKCEYCGRVLQPGMIECPGCGATIENKEEHMASEPQSVQQPSPSFNGYNGQTVNGMQAYMEFGGFWRRVVAIFIDAMVLSILIGTGIGSIPALVYFPVCEAYWAGSTIGKKAMGLKVVNYNFERITLGQAFGRYFAKLLSAMAFYIGFLMVAFTKNKQGLHDRMAATYVVHINKGIAMRQS